MNLLGSAQYDPTSAVSKATSSLLAMTALDTTNLRLAITVPSHGKVLFKLKCTLTGATTLPTILLGVLNGATVIGRQTPHIFTGTQNLATQATFAAAEFIATGLVAGAMNVDAAYAVQVVVASTNIKYGGPNNNSGANAWGAFEFEAWDPQPNPTNFGLLSIDANGRIDVIKLAGTTQTARDIGASVLLSSGAGTGQLDFTSGVVKANGTQLLGSAIPAPTVAGIPNVNAKTWNDLTTAALPLVPTTAGRTLDVSATGEAGLDWANVGSPTTSLALTGTTIATTQKVDVDTIKTNPVVNAGTVTFPTGATLASTTNITAGTIAAVTTVNGLAAGVITATSIAADAITAAKIADGAIDAATFAAGAINAAAIAADAITDTKVASDVTIASVTGAVGSVTGAVGSVTGNVSGNVTGSVGSVTGAVGSVTGNVGGNVTGSVGSVTTGGITAASFAADAITAAKIAADVGTEIGTAVWATTTRELTAGTNIVLAKGTGVTGFNDLSAAQVNAEADVALADVGVTLTVTGRIDAAITSRASQTSVDTIDDYIDTEVAAIKAKTDNLPSDPADASDIAGAFATLTSHGDIAWATATGFSTLDAAGIRAAIGLASANLDTQLDALPTNSELTAALTPILADTNELQVDWVEGGRLDLILDSRASQSSVDTIDANVDALPTLISTIRGVGYSRVGPA